MKRTYTPPVLNRKQLEKFITFIAENRSTGDFEVYLDLGRRDISFFKEKLNIETAEDAKAFLKDVVNYQAKLQEFEDEKNREDAKKWHAEAEKRLDISNKKDSEAAARRRAQFNKILDPVAVAKEDAERQRRFEQQQSKPSVAKDVQFWQLNEKEYSEDQFVTVICNQGWKFAQQMFGATRSQMIKELERRNLLKNINLDLVPR